MSSPRFDVVDPLEAKRLVDDKGYWDNLFLFEGDPLKHLEEGTMLLVDHKRKTVLVYDEPGAVEFSYNYAWIPKLLNEVDQEK